MSISYGDISFQQKTTCFGWIDRNVRADSIALTSIEITKARKIEIKSSILSAEKFANGKRLGLEDTLAAKRILLKALDIAEQEQLGRSDNRSVIGTKFSRLSTG